MSGPAPRSLRVLHVYHRDLNRYGIGSQMAAFIRHSSDPSSHHVALLFGKAGEGIELPNPPVTVVPRRGRMPMKLDAVLRLRRLIRDLDIDVVHAYNPRASVTAALAVPRGVGLVVSRHGAVAADLRRWFRWTEVPLAQRIDAVVAVSESLRADLPSSRWYPPVRVIPNAVDLSRFQPVDLPGPDAPPTVAIVAALYRRKRHDLFLRAMATVRERVPDARGIIVGDGDLRGELEELSRSLGLEGSVRFTGQVDDVRPFVAEAHVVALTSEHEGFGNVLVEAMAMGRPVVATRRGGIPEVVRDGEDGFLVDLDAGQIADALERVLTDEALRNRLRTSALERARTFGWPRKVAALEGLYGEVAGRKAGRRRGRVSR